MAILFHPNKINPQRYRVWDRETKTQKYFPLTAAGRKAAEEFEAKVAAIKKARSLSRDLDVNKLFADDGSVKGMKRVYRKRKGRPSYECLALYACHKQTELIIGERGFEETYQLAIKWLLQQHQIEERFELRKKFKEARRRYWTSVIPEEETYHFFGSGGSSGNI
ncbi:MAG: hypothetical protein CSB48_11535 [Proteobacteria bacterium]|nr:MAG: hypothetical protein CSB48_11535 [Pseudomonadota bacterium]PIE40106.1 MAG: hypothetical protein CSA51_02390 [Gammaproteobacteria bacterium]